MKGCSEGNSRTKYKNLSAACKSVGRLSYGTNETRGTHALKYFLSDVLENVNYCGTAIQFHICILDLFSLRRVSMLVRWSAFLSANKVGLLILSQENIHNSECLKENLKAVLMLFFLSQWSDVFKILVHHSNTSGFYGHILGPSYMIWNLNAFQGISPFSLKVKKSFLKIRGDFFWTWQFKNPYEYPKLIMKKIQSEHNKLHSKVRSSIHTLLIDICYPWAFQKTTEWSRLWNMCECDFFT